ncbi:FGGY-family carbohydrate kinase [Natrialba aegyptia]|uniref:Sugar kinase, FGGY family protein n=1 Tax=Natrialba aegyptia DSM 13077 TaxID=1227491 RepID=M0AIQ8_9EURY|nr:FGGY-family carbohydrate kinase [Natrialba aegyptia]ELY98565.1 sugar kinase, FGGY family protein [Natrialba aegyptia DSM 13077]
MGRVLIGIDAGTTRIKSVAFDLDGNELHRAARDNALKQPEAGKIEQDMEQTWAMTAETIREVVDSLDEPDNIVGVGVTGQGDGCWLIDEAGDPVRDAILWNDSRAAKYVNEWEETGVAPLISNICGSDLFPGASLPILQWLADEEPESIERADTVFCSKDWLKYRLTGERTTDRSDASLPFIDIETGEYSDVVPELVDIDGIDELLPRLEPASEIIGDVTTEGSEATGLPIGTPVVSGAIDIVASGIGSGAARTDDSSSVVGTTSLNQMVLSEPPEETKGTGFLFAVEDDFYVRAMASMAGTPNLDWAFEEFADDKDFTEVVPDLEELPIGSEGALYHPYLSTSGERSPFLKTSARAQFLGLSPEHSKEHMLRAVYEGVTLAMRDCYEHMSGESTRIMISGGGARSDFWCQMFADCLDTPISVPAGDEFGAKGVAFLAGVATGVYDDIASAAEETTTIDRTYEPRPECASQYDEWYEYFRDSYEAMFEVWDTREDAMDQLESAAAPPQSD